MDTCCLLQRLQLTICPQRSINHGLLLVSVLKLQRLIHNSFSYSAIHYIFIENPPVQQSMVFTLEGILFTRIRSSRSMADWWYQLIGFYDMKLLWCMPRLFDYSSHVLFWMIIWLGITTNRRRKLFYTTIINVLLYINR